MAEDRLAELTLATVRVARPRGAPGRGTLWRHSHRRGTRSSIPAKRRPAPRRTERGRLTVADRAAYRARWRVDRTFAWLLSYRRAVVR